jgi:uncharacterized protein (DUF1778 family)
MTEPKPKGRQFRATIFARVTPAEQALIQHQADMAGISLAAFIRQCALEATK